MADRENMSIADILAAAKKADGGGGDAPAESAPKAEKSAAEPAKPSAGEGSAVDKPTGQMSVAEMMAAARAEKSGDSGVQRAQDDKPAGQPASVSPAASKPAGQLSVAEMMAAARGEKPGGVTKAKASGATPKAKPKAAAKAKTPTAEATKPGGPKDTASILATARKSDKSGPVSKAEAAARETGGADRAKPQAARKAPPMPEKPAYARPEAARPRSSDGEDRRGFFGLFLGSYLAFGFTTLGLTHLLWTLGFARFMFPNILTEPPTRFKVGPPGGFAPGSVETKFKAQFGVWIVNALYKGSQVIFALKTVCTHLGCTPNWLEAEQKFKCPCHGSGFYKDGVNFEGPAPRPLERYAINIADDGQLEVDKSTTFQEEKGAWSDTASFVNV